MTIKAINSWHKAARPEPTEKNLAVQAGCHFEEVAEMLEAMDLRNPVVRIAFAAIGSLASLLKSGDMEFVVHDRKGLLDALADQIVTATGVGHCAGMDVPTACDRVNASNWSKYDDSGRPIFNAAGKIQKGPNYQEPKLDGLY